MYLGSVFLVYICFHFVIDSLLTLRVGIQPIVPAFLTQSQNKRRRDLGGRLRHLGEDCAWDGGIILVGWQVEFPSKGRYNDGQGYAQSPKEYAEGDNRLALNHLLDPTLAVDSPRDAVHARHGAQDGELVTVYVNHSFPSVRSISISLLCCHPKVQYQSFPLYCLKQAAPRRNRRTKIVNQQETGRANQRDSEY